MSDEYEVKPNDRFGQTLSLKNLAAALGDKSTDAESTAAVREASENARREIDRLNREANSTPHPLAAENARLRSMLKQSADELENYIDAYYSYTKSHPAIQAKYDLDMTTVKEARALLAGKPLPPAPQPDAVKVLREACVKAKSWIGCCCMETRINPCAGCVAANKAIDAALAATEGV